ncbi:DUF3120 domain-containing protein [Merismopedia glauca]|uniref:DUF3120 domain-containing protein n=1 Tax=Merismopedia glauca CCAP 1448/3 TaxID=1296344 RepID=A0A2T1C164_9CYAN|nr:DUF3120 domain-containing protein [Merismopedia glauca]PSB01944.1 DUF3120 domain-containing protein [Merismopedia glauca CCAP 1448/3]
MQNANNSGAIATQLTLKRWSLAAFLAHFRLTQAGWIFGAAAFLVSVPVFVQAPLVRYYPWLSLFLTLGWIWLGKKLLNRAKNQIWGDLLVGFAWSWLAGSIYWGWYRWEPLYHLPIEAIGLPLALLALWRLWGDRSQKTEYAFWECLMLQSPLSSLFYLGSLLGTAVTDLYFFLTGVIHHWRLLMTVEPELAAPILQEAITFVRTPWGVAWGVVLANFLLGLSFWALGKQELHWRAFAGAVLCTILVDCLFAVLASMA